MEEDIRQQTLAETKNKMRMLEAYTDTISGVYSNAVLEIYSDENLIRALREKDFYSLSNFSKKVTTAVNVVDFVSLYDTKKRGLF